MTHHHKLPLPTHMEMQPVVSSQVAAIGYDETTKKMRVTFKPFKPENPLVTYEYSNVTPELHRAIIGAESIGREINQRIKKLPGSYPHRKLTREEAAQ